MRQVAVFQLAQGQYKDIRYRMLNWAKQFSILFFADSNNYSSAYDRFECLLAVGQVDVIKENEGDKLNALHSFHNDCKDWLVGHICYDYKNELERKLTSAHTVQLGFPSLYFFRPQIVCHVNKQLTELTIEALGIAPEKVFEEVITSPVDVPSSLPSLQFQQRFNQEEYVQTINRLRQHIADGDCYEINFCNEGYTYTQNLDTQAVFHALNALSPAPFAAYYRLQDRYLMCASPERYLRRQGDIVLSQPIKGTARRGKNAQEDQEIKSGLQQNIKERAENVMIVDLVRNDLARSCQTGSVRVDELFGIYTFPQVHQMISTVLGSARAEQPFTESIRHSFPMGSMTGAPKIMVMQLIDRYEKARRELFAGTVGYIMPNGDFDFNVVIRSLYYNAATAYLSYQTGGAITYDSDPQMEWEEMKLKAWALERIFV